MGIEGWFLVTNLLVLPVWVLLAALPEQRWLTHLVAPVVMPAALSFVYLVLVLANLGVEGGGSMGSLGGVREMFSHDAILLAGWIHYLAFGLFVGSWEVRDARRRGVPHLAVVPCLGFTYLVGPIGFFAYLLLRLYSTRGEGLSLEI